MNKELKNVIEKFNRTNVLVVGDLMIDQYVYGTVTRISPEAPVPVVDVEKELCVLGGAANTVNTIISLGGNVDAVGVIGTDDAGRILLDQLNKKNINTTGIISCKVRPTTVKTRIIGNGSNIVRIDKET